MTIPLMIPHIIHLMYFPWDREQRLNADPEDFDHSPVEAMRKYAPGMEVRLWTYPKVAELCKEFYPDVWEDLQRVARPVMMVDVLRWVVIHKFGGIYWQMNTTPLVRMEEFLPAAGKAVRLFTEFDLNPEQCRQAMQEPIRNGEPEEATRILIGTFSAVPEAPFVENIIRFLQARVSRYHPQKDYDVLFITGNAAASTAYDQFGRNDPGVQLTDLATSRQMMKLHYEGAWRTDRTGTPPSGPKPQPRPISEPPFCARQFRNLYFRHMAVHPHEALFSARTVRKDGCALRQLISFIREQNVKRVVEVADAPLAARELPAGLEVVRLHPSRAVIAERKSDNLDKGADWRHVNLFYSTIPRGDLFVCSNYLERISFSEAQRILTRIEANGFRHLAFTNCPLMERNWDSALGDVRPLNLCLAPFNLGRPVASVPWPDPDGRPDRCLAIWATP